MSDMNIPGKRVIRVEPAPELMFMIPGFVTMKKKTTMIKTVTAMGA